jgi:cation diffusion facilitator CzcD-associated flavoprotein CzcO
VGGEATRDVYDVVVIGAGLAGLTTGEPLAHAGTSVLVVDADGKPGGTPRRCAATAGRSIALTISSPVARRMGCPRRRDVRPGDSPRKSTVRSIIDCFRNRRGPQAARSPWRIASPNLGRALLKRSGADARIISMVNPDGFE